MDNLDEPHVVGKDDSGLVVEANQHGWRDQDLQLVHLRQLAKLEQSLIATNQLLILIFVG